MRHALTVTALTGLLLGLPGPVEAKGGLFSRLIGSRILNPLNWSGGYPKGARVIFRKPDRLDDRMLDHSYYFGDRGQIRQREVLSVRLTGSGPPLSSGEILGQETSVTGVYTQLYDFRCKLEAARRSMGEFQTLDVRHTHPGSVEPHRHHFSPKDRRSALNLREYLDSSASLRHLVLRESIVFEKGGGKQLTRVKTFELPARKDARGN